MLSPTISFRINKSLRKFISRKKEEAKHDEVFYSIQKFGRPNYQNKNSLLSMHFLLTLFLIHTKSDTMGIDCGSFFTKSAISQPFENPSVGLFHQSKRTVPSFIAFRAKPQFNFSIKYSLTEGELEFLTPEFGERALNVMEVRPWMGSGYFSYLAGTELRELFDGLHINNTAARVKYNDLVALYLNYYIKSIYGNTSLSEVTLVFPATATPYQRLIFQKGLEAIGIANSSSIDDVDAASYVYTLEKISKFAKSSKTVLFIDVGATSIKAYVVKFELSNKKPKVTRQSYSIRYSVGGAFITNGIVDYMINKIHLDREISVSERQRLFTAAEKLKIQLTLLDKASVFVENVNERDFEYKMTREELEAIPALSTDLITSLHKVIEEATKKVKAFDEVELMGGCSRIPFVQKELESILNPMKKAIGHSMNQDEVLAIGAGYYSQYQQKQSKYQPIEFINNQPIYSVSIVTQSQTVDLCQRTGSCTKEIQLLGNISEIEYRLVKYELPKGVTKNSIKYEIPKFEQGTFHITFTHTAQIAEIEKCDKVKCDSIGKKFNVTNPPPISTELISIFVDKNLRDERIAKLRHQIEEFSERVLHEVEKNVSVRFFSNHTTRLHAIRTAEKMKKWAKSEEAQRCKNLQNFTSRFSELKRSIGPVYVRIEENRTFYENVEALQMMMNLIGQAAEQFGAQAPNMDKSIIYKLKDKLAKAKIWMKESVEKNAKANPSQFLPVRPKVFKQKEEELSHLFKQLQDVVSRTPRDPNFRQNREALLKQEEQKMIKKWTENEKKKAKGDNL